MQVVILCGGSGTRLREETEFRPKPMIHIGGKPMLWHIMKLYGHYGFKRFVLALGYKQEIIKEYFLNYQFINNDLSIYPILDHFCMEIVHRHVAVGQKGNDFERLLLSDTGLNTLKGARIKRVEKYIQGSDFMLTYGDGIGDINIAELVKFHQSHGKIATVTGVHPRPRFGEIHHNEGRVISFTEKPIDGDTLINGGFFVLKREIFDYLVAQEWCDFETGPLELIAQKGELMVYHHKGYWGCMDTLREMHELNDLWERGEARWKVW